MKTKMQFLLLLISVSFFSCNSTIKKPAVSVSNIDTDFPITEELELNPFNKYDICYEGVCAIDDSILWYIKIDGTDDFGACYNLRTGEKLSTIASKGRAAHELTVLEGFDMVGDSIQFYTYGNRIIKSFAKKDIINNVPMGERGFSLITTPDSILISRMIKLSNGSVLATIRPSIFEYEQTKMNEFNQKTIAIFNDKEAKSYETIDYENFDIEKAGNKELSSNDLVKMAYSDGLVGIKNNDVAVFSVSNQFILYTFDINDGNVVNERIYTKMQRIKRDKSFTPFSTKNDKHMKIHSMKVSDEHILCMVSGYLSEEDKKLGLLKEAIFVFDWGLNPIKKFDLPNRENGYYCISNDCNSVYFCEKNEDALILYKADLNI
ncbi:hypothetical protein [Bacteroides acidifaciens]|uniref:hypothetical protein n=1 Tax=Bacteroides acidifaciens TaxID=85831 RepID=UPI0026F1C2F9|nr:hypothetical protein [Bacteroides acidifaciens]